MMRQNTNKIRGIQKKKKAGKKEKKKEKKAPNKKNKYISIYIRPYTHTKEKDIYIYLTYRPLYRHIGTA